MTRANRPDHPGASTIASDWMDPFSLGLRLTLLILLLSPVGSWSTRPAILGLAGLGLLAPRLLAHPALWFSLGILTGARVILDWPLADNHAYLLCYWCLAIALALVSGRPGASLALSGRMLIGLVFLFASLWKLVLSPHYADGLFFRITLLTDPRFEGFAQLVGGLSPEMYDSLRAMVRAHIDGPAAVGPAGAVEPARFVSLARAAAIWNAGLNLAIAACFLWPQARGLSRYRDALLLIFCVVTYAVATVASFGWLLIAMAVAQTPHEQRRKRWIYLAVFGVILLYREIPWADAVFRPLLAAGAS